MATRNLLSRPPAGRPAQHSCSCSSRKNSSKCTPPPTQALSLDSKANSGKRSTLFAAKVATEAEVSQQGFGLISLWNDVFALKHENWKLNPSQTQRFIERAIVDCRFFTFFAIAGSLLGSILCFVELYIRWTMEILWSYLLRPYAMLIFGMELYVVFFGSKILNHQRQQPTKHSKSNIFSIFYLEITPSWLKMESVSEAKTRIGHVVLMILQARMLEKLKSAPLVNGFDLASFAEAVLLSCAYIFCLSKLSRSQGQEE